MGMSTRRLVAAAVCAVLAVAALGESSISASGSQWRALTLPEAADVIAKARTFEAAERRRRRVENNAARDWYGSLTLVGTARDIVLASMVEIDGRRYRIVLPGGNAPVDVGSGEYRIGSFGSFLIRNVLWTSRSQTIPGTTVLVRHTYGRKRGGPVLPNRCGDFYTSTSPVRLYARAFARYLNGARSGYCAWGLDERSPK